MSLQTSGSISISQIRTALDYNNNDINSTTGAFLTSGTYPPTLTSNQDDPDLPSYIASASTNSSTAFRAADNTGVMTVWQSATGVYNSTGVNYLGSVTTLINGSAVAGEWLQYEFVNGISNVSSVFYTATGSTTSFGRVVVCGSNDNLNFTQLVAIGPGNINGTYAVSSSLNTSFRYIRTVVREKYQSGNTWCAIAKFMVTGVEGNGGELSLNLFRDITGYGAISLNDLYGQTEVVNRHNWWNTFSTIGNGAFTMQLRYDTYPNVQLRMTSNAIGSTVNSVLYDFKLQTYNQVVIDFEAWTSGTADDLSFHMGLNTFSAVGVRASPAFSVNIHVYNPTRTRGIYLYNDSGTSVANYIVDTNQTVWRSITIIYTRSTTNTWRIYNMGILRITYSNPNNETWVTNSGTYFGFGATTGGLNMDSYIRNVRVVYK